MRLSSPPHGYRHFQANDEPRADEVVLFSYPARWVHWELGEQGPQVPPGYAPCDDPRGSATRKRRWWWPF